MKISINKFIAFALSMILVTSCYKDLGSYTLSDINEVLISFPETSYRLYPGDTLSVMPELSYTLDKGADTSRYTYNWYYHKTFDEDYGGDQQSRSIATTINLNYKVALSFGFWDIYMTVTDKTTDVQFVEKIQLEVLSNRLKGWMLLTETGADPKLGMISYDNEGNDSVISDILALRESSVTLTGTPLDLFTFQNGDLYITTTENGTFWVDPITYQTAPQKRLKYQMADPAVPENFYAEKLAYEGFYKEGNFYTIVANLYGIPNNKVPGEPNTVPIAPFIAYPPWIYGSQYIFDTENKRILEVPYDQTYSRTMENETLFSWTTGKDLLYMTYSRFNDNEVFAILKDPATSKVYLARWKRDQVQTAYTEITSGTNIAQGEHFTVNSEYGYIFYSVGGKLYEFDLGLKTSKLMADYSPNLINRLDVGDLLYDQSEGLTNKLVVASYDPGAPLATSGTLETFTVPGLNANIVKTGSYTGLGKIIDITYKE